MRARNRRWQIGRRLNRARRVAQVALTFPPDDERRSALLSIVVAELAELGIEVIHNRAEEIMHEHTDWNELRDRRMSEPGAAQAYEAARREHQQQTEQAADEAALAALLSAALIDIRFALAPLRDDVPERRRMHNAWIIADLCHNLPGFLDPSRRSRIREGIAYAWSVSSKPRLTWIRSHWDHIGYDYSWLPDRVAGPEEDRGWHDVDQARKR